VRARRRGTGVVRGGEVLAMIVMVAREVEVGVGVVAVVDGGN
jgi:hypothetical protein